MADFLTRFALAGVTNYVAWGVAESGWEANGLAAFADSPATNGFTVANSNVTVYAKAYRDLNRNGEYDEGADVLLAKAIPASARPTVRFAFGDVDGDGVSDAQERLDGTDPYDAGSFRLSLTVVFENSDASAAATNYCAWGPGAAWTNCGAASFAETACVTVSTVVANGVAYAKCLRDFDADGEYAEGGDILYVRELTKADNGKTVTVAVGDRDADGIPDSKEVEEGTDPRDAKNYRLRRRIDAATIDPVLGCTNYLSVSLSSADWSASAVVTSFVCTSVSADVDVIVTNGYAYLKCLRDFDADGTYASAEDVLYSASLAARATGDVYVFGVGDRDGDGICDSEEVAEGTSPQNSNEYCFSLAATVAGIFEPSNRLAVVAYFGNATNILYGPCVQSNGILTVDFGHLSTTMREKVSFLFWEDLDGSGVWNVGERKTFCAFTVSEHVMSVTNVLELGDFDADGDGMLDDWEVEHGLSPTSATDAVLDADGDGLLNLHEYIAKTDPNNIDDDGAESAPYAAAHGVDDRIAVSNASVSKPYYVGYPWQGVGVTDEVQNVSFSYNTNCWMHGVDLTCMSVWEDSPPGEWRVAFTAITPQHVISAKHVAPQNGTRMTFQSSNCEVIVRTLVAQTFIPGVADNDLWIGLLDMPLPDSITPAKFLPPDYARYIGTGRKLPIVRIGRDKTCSIHDIVYLAPSEKYQCMCRLEYSTCLLRSQYKRGPWRMDSGHPLFILFGDELAFVCPAKGYYYSDNQATGYLCTYYHRLIQRATDGLSMLHDVNLLKIEEVDLTVYLQGEGGAQ